MGLPSQRRMLIHVLGFLQFPRVMRFFQRHRVPILMYHGFREDAPCPVGQNEEGNHLNVKAFERQAKYLAEHHSIVSLKRFADSIASGERLPDNSVVITIDDGYKSNATLALPVLAAYQAHATVFITTGFVDDREPLWPDRLEWAIACGKPEIHTVPIGNESVAVDLTSRTEASASAAILRERLKDMPQANQRRALDAIEETLGAKLSAEPSWPEMYRPLDWDDIKTMLNSGWVDIGNHTHSHFILSGCEPQVQEDEINSAARSIESRAGTRATLFCYPNGQPEDYTAATIKILRDGGYECAVTTTPGINDQGSPVFELKRLAINDSFTFDEFRFLLYGGLSELIGALKSAVRSGLHPSLHRSALRGQALKPTPSQNTPQKHP